MQELSETLCDMEHAVDTWVCPTLQMGVINLLQDSSVTSLILSDNLARLGKQ